MILLLWFLPELDDFLVSSCIARRSSFFGGTTPSLLPTSLQRQPGQGATPSRDGAVPPGPPAALLAPHLTARPAQVRRAAARLRPGLRLAPRPALLGQRQARGLPTAPADRARRPRIRGAAARSRGPTSLCFCPSLVPLISPYLTSYIRPSLSS